MYDAEVYRKRAQHCVEKANQPSLSHSEQIILLRMAAKWNELADDAARVQALLGDALKEVSSEPHLD
jgi:hypothetical protein